MDTYQSIFLSPRAIGKGGERIYYYSRDVAMKASFITFKLPSKKTDLTRFPAMSRAAFEAFPYAPRNLSAAVPNNASKEIIDDGHGAMMGPEDRQSTEHERIKRLEQKVEEQYIQLNKQGYRIVQLEERLDALQRSKF